MAKLLLLLRAIDGESLDEALAVALKAEFAGDLSLTVQLMKALPEDPFYNPDAHILRPQSVLELIVRAGLPLEGYYQHLSRSLRELPVADDSQALVMQHRWYIDAPPQPVHYHQLMFRKAGWSRADYMDYYSRFHCRMGFNTPAIEGYIQNYVDPEASAALASLLGLSTIGADSISELTMVDPNRMLSHPDVEEVAHAAAADEARFLDRSLNVAFCSQVTLRIGDFDDIVGPALEQYYGDYN